MANWEALECVLQVEAVIMQQQHDSLFLIVIISRVSHIRQILGVHISYAVGFAREIMIGSLKVAGASWEWKKV